MVGLQGGGGSLNVNLTKHRQSLSSSVICTLLKCLAVVCITKLVQTASQRYRACCQVLLCATVQFQLFQPELWTRCLNGSSLPQGCSIPASLLFLHLPGDCGSNNLKINGSETTTKEILPVLWDWSQPPPPPSRNALSLRSSSLCRKTPITWIHFNWLSWRSLTQKLFCLPWWISYTSICC